MVIMKRLTATLAAGATSLTFTDAAMNSNSIIEIYAVDMDVYPINQQQTGEHSVTVTFDAQQESVNVVCLINNIMSLSHPEEASYVLYDNSDTGILSDNVQGAIDEVFQSVSDGKTLIAAAITDKGVPTAATDSFAVMAGNIIDIPTDTGGKVKMMDLDSDNVSRLVGFTTPQVQWRNTTGYSTVLFDLGELKSIKWLAVLFQGDAKPDMWRVTTRQDTNLTENQYNDNYMSDDYNKNVLAHTQAFTNLRAANPYSIRRVFVCIGWYDQTLDYWKQHAKIQLLYEEAEEV